MNNSSKKTVLITGANRGIGLSFIKSYLKRGWKVIGTARNPSDAHALQNLLTSAGSENLKILPLDVSDENSINQLPELIKGVKLNLLINNAGVYINDGKIPEDKLNSNSILNQFKVNSLGPLLISTLLLPNLELGSPSKIVNITSRLGSIGDNSSGNSYGYRASKAALNMFTKTLHLDFTTSGKHIAVLALHPGYVQTDMSDQKGDISPDEAVERMISRIDELYLSNSGRFLHRDGQELPW